jgi:transcriptional regulator with XRE-family HTH domain
MLYVIKDMGRYVTELRAEKSIAVEEIAKHLKVSPGTIARWETQNYKCVTLAQLERILEVLER